MVWCSYITSHISKRPVTKRPLIKRPSHYTSTVLVRPCFQVSPFHNLSLSVMPMSHVHAKRSLWVCTRSMTRVLYGYAVHARVSFWVWLTLCCDRLGRDCKRPKTEHTWCSRQVCAVYYPIGRRIGAVDPITNGPVDRSMILTNQWAGGYVQWILLPLGRWIGAGSLLTNEPADMCSGSYYHWAGG
jgi:hypothetical protein